MHPMASLRATCGGSSCVASSIGFPGSNSGYQTIWLSAQDCFCFSFIFFVGFCAYTHVHTCTHTHAYTSRIRAYSPLLHPTAMEHACVLWLLPLPCCCGRILTKATQGTEGLFGSPIAVHHQGTPRRELKAGRWRQELLLPDLLPLVVQLPFLWSPHSQSGKYPVRWALLS